MFFGMCNSPATFQLMMDKIFATMIDGKLVIIYMDDILIFAETKEELRQTMRWYWKNFEKTFYSSKQRNASLRQEKLNT